MKYIVGMISSLTICLLDSHYGKYSKYGANMLGFNPMIIARPEERFRTTITHK